MQGRGDPKTLLIFPVKANVSLSFLTFSITQSHKQLTDTSQQLCSNGRSFLCCPSEKPRKQESGSPSKHPGLGLRGAEHCPSVTRASSCTQAPRVALDKYAWTVLCTRSKSKGNIWPQLQSDKQIPRLRKKKHEEDHQSSMPCKLNPSEALVASPADLHSSSFLSEGMATSSPAGRLNDSGTSVCYSQTRKA